MRIALLGCGTVGGGVYEFVQERTDMEIAYVLSRRPRPELNCPVTSDFSRIVSDPTVDTAIEVMGGRQPAYEYMCAALRARTSSRRTSSLCRSVMASWCSLPGRIMSPCAAQRPAAAASAG